MVQLRHIGGALTRRAPGAGARATLPGEIACSPSASSPSRRRSRRSRRRSRRLAAVAPHHAGDYPNFVEQPADARAFFDAETWRRLREVKADYDPQDVFKANHHIPPARAGSIGVVAVARQSVEELASAPASAWREPIPSFR